MKGFISYSHEDHRAYGEFRRHLRAIERSLGMDFWADKRIKAGNYWSQKIADAIDAAQVHLLLFSPAFIASDYIFDHELPAINAKASSGDLIIPVVISRCSWDAFVGVLQAVPTNDAGRLLPVLEWRPATSGHDAARDQLQGAICDHFKLAPKSPFSWGRP